MLSAKIIFAFGILSYGLVSVYAADGMSERCTITEGAGISVDSCDGSKYLACRSGRCECQDHVNQIYTYRLVAEKSRTKRKAGKGKGGGYKKPVIAAAAGAAVGYGVARATSGSSSSSSSDSSFSYSRNKDNNKYKKVFSCYGRVGAQCVLELNNVNIVSITTTTTTTTAAPNVTAIDSSTTTTTAPTTTPEGVTTVDTNVTTTTTAAPAPVAAALLAELPKLPMCVQHAVCNPKGIPSNNNTNQVYRMTDSDPRIGSCECKTGYTHNNADLCIKSGSNFLQASLLMVIGIIMATKALY